MLVRFFIFVFFLIVCTSFAPQREAIDFEATTIEGEKIKLSSLKKKVVVLNFWFKNCKPCRMEIPELHLLAKKYQNKDVVFIALALDSEEVVKEYVSENNFSYKHIANARPIAKEWGIKSYPTNVVINKKGKVVFQVSGLEMRADANGQPKPKTPEDIEKEIEKALKK